MYTSCTQMCALHLRTQTTQRGPWLSMHHHDPHERPSGSTPPLVGMPAACPIRSVTHVHAHIISTRHSRMHLDGALGTSRIEVFKMNSKPLQCPEALSQPSDRHPGRHCRLPHCQPFNHRKSCQRPTAPVNYARAAASLCSVAAGRDVKLPDPHSCPPVACSITSQSRHPPSSRFDTMLCPWPYQRGRR